MCLPRGVSPLGYPPAHCMLGYTPGTEFLTHTGENISFPQLLLRAVKIELTFLIQIQLSAHSLKHKVSFSGSPAA